VVIEGFEDAWPPEGWAVIHLGDSYTWDRTNAEQHSGTYSAYVRYSPVGVQQDEYLVTEVMDFSALTVIFLEFYEDQSYWPGYGEHHYIGVSTTSQTDPAAFTMIVDWTPADHDIAGFDGDPVTINLSDYAGEPTVYVCFRYTGDYADNWYVDDVIIYQPYAHDVMVTDVMPDGEQYVAPYPLAPQVIVENRGTNPEVFDVQLQIEESGNPVYDELVGVTLAVAQVDTVDFPVHDLNPGQFYDLFASANLAEDMDTLNNVGSAFVDTYTQPHVPLGHLHTNAGCGPCGTNEPYLDNFLPGEGNNVALIRVHTWWPGYDPMYYDNILQCQELIYSYAADYTPHLWVDGVIDAGYEGPTWPGLLTQRKSVFSPALIDLHWLPATEQLMARVNLREPLSGSCDARLRVAITEDNIIYAGGNGHNTHHQVFKHMYPDTDGLSVPCGIDTYTFLVDCPLGGGLIYEEWTYENLRATVYLQDNNDWRVWQAGTGFLTELTGQLTLDPAVSAVDAGEYFTVAVDITPAVVEVMGIEAQIDFDPTVVRLDSITAGAWFTGSGEDFFFSDHTPEPPDTATSIHFDAALLGAAAADSGRLAICHFQALAAGEIPLTWSLADVRDSLNTGLGFATSTEDSILVGDDLTGVDDPAPAQLRLLGNQPNPFNPSTLIRYELPEDGHWRVEVFDVRGRRVASLVDGWQAAGRYAQSWDGRNTRGELLGSGLYLLRVSGPAGSRSGKMLLLK